MQQSILMSFVKGIEISLAQFPLFPRGAYWGMVTTLLDDMPCLAFDEDFRKLGLTMIP